MRNSSLPEAHVKSWVFNLAVFKGATCLNKIGWLRSYLWYCNYLKSGQNCIPSTGNSLSQMYAISCGFGTWNNLPAPIAKVWTISSPTVQNRKYMIHNCCTVQFQKVLPPSAWTSVSTSFPLLSVQQVPSLWPWIRNSAKESTRATLWKNTHDI